MEPKFQSSFIPKGPVSSASAPTAASFRRAPVQRDFFAVIASALFTLSLIFAIGVFGYKYYLNYRIAGLGRELEAARAALEPKTVDELVRLDERIVSTQELLANHRIISPVFDFLQQATPQSVRYTGFQFNSTEKGLELALKGEARSYSALAVASDIITNKSPQFKNAVFSDLILDPKGNVTFSLSMRVDPSALSFGRSVSLQGLSPAPQTAQPQSQAASTTPAAPAGAASTSTAKASTTTGPSLPPVGGAKPAGR